MHESAHARASGQQRTNTPALPQLPTGRAHARVAPHAHKHARKNAHTRARTDPSRADAHTLLRRRAAAERRAMRVANLLAFKQKPDAEIERQKCANK